MKWVKTKWGHKYVQDDYNAPEDKEFSRIKKPIGIPSIILKQSWVSESEKYMPDPRKMDANGESKATEIMVAQREKELRTSSKARNWEEGRKKEWKRNKPYWKKDRQFKKDLHIQKVIKEVESKY